MKKRFRSKILFTAEHPEADRRYIVRGVVRYGLRRVDTLTAQGRAEPDRASDAYEADSDAGRPAKQIIADIRKSLGLRNNDK
jgi:hypothetical protein